MDTPIREGEVRRLRTGDILYLDGEIFTARDAAHRRALKYHEEGKKLPISTHGKPLYHCGPLIKRLNGEYKVISAGPTTSMRMEDLEYEFLKRFRVPAIIGKGGMGSKTIRAAKEFGAVYCAFTGGAGALAGRSFRKVKRVEWLDLGMPEALWIIEVEKFGPLTVAIDSHGSSLYSQVTERVEINKDKLYEMMGFNAPIASP